MLYLDCSSIADGAEPLETLEEAVAAGRGPALAAELQARARRLEGAWLELRALLAEAADARPGRDSCRCDP